MKMTNFTVLLAAFGELKLYEWSLTPFHFALCLYAHIYIVLLWLQRATSQTQIELVQCPGLSSPISTTLYPYCELVTNSSVCSAIQCTVESQTATLAIHPCTDPLEISVVIRLTSGLSIISTSFIHSYTDTREVSNSANGTTVFHSVSGKAPSVYSVLVNLPHIWNSWLCNLRTL